MSTYVESYGHFRTVMCIFEKDTICLGISIWTMVRDQSWWFTWHVRHYCALRCTGTVESISPLFDFSVRSWSTGPKRANGALCSRIFAPLNAEFEPRFCSRVQKHQLRASNGERSKNRVTFDPFFSVRRSLFAVQGTNSRPHLPHVTSICIFWELRGILLW